MNNSAKPNHRGKIIGLALMLSLLGNLVFVYLFFGFHQQVSSVPFHPAVQVRGITLVRNGFVQAPTDMPILIKKINEDESIRYALPYFQESRFKTLINRGTGLRDTDWSELFKANLAEYYVYEAYLDSDTDSRGMAEILQQYDVKIVSRLERQSGDYRASTFYARHTPTRRVFSCVV